MNLTAVAQQLFDAAQSGSLESVDQPLDLLNATLQQQHVTGEELVQAHKLLSDTRTALYVRRAHIVRALQQNRTGSLYGDALDARHSWEFSG